MYHRLAQLLIQSRGCLKAPPNVSESLHTKAGVLSVIKYWHMLVFSEVAVSMQPGWGGCQTCTVGLYSTGVRYRPPCLSRPCRPCRSRVVSSAACPAVARICQGGWAGGGPPLSFPFSCTCAWKEKLSCCASSCFLVTSLPSHPPVCVTQSAAIQRCGAGSGSPENR